MAAINNKGTYTTLDEAWAAMPAGGTVGDFIYLGDERFEWDAILGNWAYGGYIPTNYTVPSDDTVSTQKIKNEAVTTDKLANGAVTQNKLADGAVSGMKIQEAAITEAHIQDCAVNSDKIAQGAITTAHIGDEMITSEKLDDSAVTTNKLANSAVTTNKLNGSSVTSDKIADKAIHGRHLADNIISENAIANDAIHERHISTGSVTGVHLADGAVVSSKLANGAVSTDAIADGSITLSKLAGDVTERLSGGEGVFPMIFGGVQTAVSIADNDARKGYVFVSSDSGQVYNGSSSFVTKITNITWMGNELNGVPIMVLSCGSMFSNVPIQPSIASGTIQPTAVGIIRDTIYNELKLAIRQYMGRVNGLEVRMVGEGYGIEIIWNQGIIHAAKPTDYSGFTYYIDYEVDETQDQNGILSVNAGDILLCTKGRDGQVPATYTHLYKATT